MSGRHIILLGILACAGLLSVHDGQQQIDCCYRLGSLEKDLRDVRTQIQLCKIQHRALQSPKAVIEKADALHLAVRPPEFDGVAQAAPTIPNGPNGPKPPQIPKAQGQ